MNRQSWIVIIVCPIIGIILMAFFYGILIKQQAMPISAPRSVNQIEQKPNIPESSTPSRKTQIVQMNPIKSITSVEEVAQLLSSYTPVEVGAILSTGDNNQQLLIDGKPVFEAKKIGNRSKATGGTVTLDAITGNQIPIDRAEIIDGKLLASYNEIWLIVPGKPPEKISPNDVDAVNPVISQDGKKVAFTGRIINEAGFPGPRQLYVLDLRTNEYTIFNHANQGRDYHIGAIDWLDQGGTLRVFTDYGETGGHAELIYIKP